MLSKYNLLQYLTEGIKNSQQSVQGIGDDAAVLVTENNATLSTVRLFQEGIHFDLTYTPLKHLGFKMVVVSISNLLAMNVLPKQLLIGLGISQKITVNQLKELYDGILTAAEYYQIDIVGGDLVPSLTGLSVSTTAIATAEPTAIVYRHNAKVNDLVCLTGDLGAAYFGLHILEREKKVFETNPNKTPELSGYDYILERWLRPTARYKTIKDLQEENIRPTAMTDICNGLAAAVLNIAQPSQTAIHLYLDKIPIASETFAIAEELNMDAVTAAMNGGGDYELLFTVPLACYEQVKKMQTIEVIGHVVAKEQKSLLIPPNGEPVEIKSQITTESE